MNSLQTQIVRWVVSEVDFIQLLATGMFFEWFPECTGTWENFKKFKEEAIGNKTQSNKES